MERTPTRRPVTPELKRGLILDAARQVFTETGLEGASLRSIAARAGYTPAALYFHFESKEAIYAELLRQSLEALAAAVAAGGAGETAGERLRGAALGFFHFYRERPHDLDLGFYGMRPRGVGRERDRNLNQALAGALRPITEAFEGHGLPAREAAAQTADLFAHAVGLLVLAHTGRIRLFGASPTQLMERHLDERLALFASRPEVR